MARKYTREELRERLRRSVYKVVTEDGIEGVTVRKVSKDVNFPIHIFTSVTEISLI